MRHFIFVLPLIAVAATLVPIVFSTGSRIRYRRPILALALYGVGHFSMLASAQRIRLL